MAHRYQITVSDRVNEILEMLLTCGIYGRTIPEIIKRFVDAKLVSMVEIGAIKSKPHSRN